MKISKSLRDAHAAAKEKYDRLAEEVKVTLKSAAEDRGWFFTCRVKELESFALKVETGRVPDINTMEDFLGCTIVVPNALALPAAEELVRSLYDPLKRRPPSDDATHKASSSFVFDDIRQYVARRSLGNGRNEDLSGLPFEIQIRTVLQYAWGIATHDLVYKADTVSWSMERIAFQVKAMLEHAEIAIAEAPSLAKARPVAKEDMATARLSLVLEQVSAFWPADQLPFDIKRLATSIGDLLQAGDQQPADLTRLLEAERDRLGTMPVNLSPYAFTVQALANNPGIGFRDKFNRKWLKTVLVVTSDMELPAWMNTPHDRIQIIPAS